MKKRSKHSQVGVEYLIIMGFITFIIIAILGVAFFYSSSIKDRIKIIQMNNFANKITSTSESVFYAGFPSKATITGYLPEGIKDIEINEAENLLIISIQLSSGLTKSAFSSNVPISEGDALSIVSGLKKIEIKAEEEKVVVNQV